MAKLTTNPPVILDKIRLLLEALHQNNISYCHWKSNQHLDASMTGKTDLDILFGEKQKTKVELLLSNHDFKRFIPIKQKQYKDIVDFIGLDHQTGVLIHVHTHYRLTLGESYLKGYQLDLEDRILESRVFNTEFGIYCINPVLEYILLYLRESLKVRFRDTLRTYLYLKRRCSENILKEYQWLRIRIENAEVFETLKSITANNKIIYEIVIHEIEPRKLISLASIIKRELAPNKMYSPISALCIRWYREATVIASRKLSDLTGYPILSKRINPRGGLSIAVIGADGSGKSTITRNLKETFGDKLDVYNIYFGRGDGKSSFIRKVLSSVKKKFYSDKRKKTIDKNPKTYGNDQNFIRNIYKCFEALIVAMEKRRNIRNMIRAKDKGMLVICDRFPQNQFMGYNDGPILHRFLGSRNFLYRTAANMEIKAYELAEKNPPDMIFKLIADATVIDQRKPGETSLQMLKTKINGIEKLIFKDNCKVLTIDAALPLDKVLYKIKSEMWSSM